MTRRITVFDTTLRDGEQSIGLAFAPAEKVAIAQSLERLGVDVIEAGFPVASEGELAGVRAVAEAVRGPVVAAMARPAQVDLDAAAAALEPAARSRVHIVLASSDLHLERKLQLSRAEVVELARWSVDYARARFDEVEFCCEDASRSDPAFLAELCGAAVEAGASVINLPDTVGFAVPEQYGALIRDVQERCPALGSVTVAVHCHDDLGLATANTLAGLAAGARQVECTMNGLGERAGNAALEEVVAALVAHRDELGVETGIDPGRLTATSRLVAELSGYPLSPHKPVVGSNVREDVRVDLDSA
jgi:2-isopropylmalate synthase